MQELMDLIKALRIALFRKSPFLAFALDQMEISYLDEDNPKYVKVIGREIVIYRNALSLEKPQFAAYVIKAIIHSVLYHSLRARRLYRKLGFDKEMERLILRVAKAVDAIPITFRDIARVAAEIVAWRIFPRRLRGIAYKFDEEFLRKLLGDDWEGDSMEQIFFKLLGELSEKASLLPILVERAGHNVFDEEEMTKVDDGEDLDDEIRGAEGRLLKVASMTENFSKLAGLEESTGIRKLIEDILKQKPLPWEVLLRRFLNGHYRKQFKSTWKYVSRKHPELPGYEMYNRPRLIAAVDVSGSIDDEEYSKFCREVMRMVRLGMDGRFICWDTKAKDYGAIKNISDLKRRAGKDVSGYGGTVVSSLKPVLDGLKAGSGDLLIVLTDGEWREGESEAKEFIKRYKCGKVLVTTKHKRGGFDLVVEVK
jgi:predicted metal-dependent peptidase